MMKHEHTQYPLYIPSKGRAQTGLTARYLAQAGQPFWLVIEPQEYDEYAAQFGEACLLTLPFVNPGSVIPARNWIKAHACQAGYDWHWQLDDNIRYIKRRYHGKRIPCAPGKALRIVETFVDRYSNIGVAGLNYEMFLPNGQKVPPFYLNVHVYSCSLINNRLPLSWRGQYNEDTDYCLQVLSRGWCTVLMNCFFVWKQWTMQMSGGNTTALYQGEGRLKMARALERRWPYVVETQRRFRRPQHVIRDQWLGFDTPLELKPGIDLDSYPPIDEHGLQLRHVKPLRNRDLAIWAVKHGVRA